MRTWHLLTRETGEEATVCGVPMRKRAQYFLGDQDRFSYRAEYVTCERCRRVIATRVAATDGIESP